MSKTLHALATSSMLTLLFLLLSVGTVWAEQQPNLSSRADVDSRIISLLDKIEFTLVMSPDIPFDEVGRMLVSAQNLMPSASAQVRHLMHEFPTRLRKRANEDQNNGVKVVALTVFADAITKYFNEDSKTTRPEVAAEQPPVVLADTEAPTVPTIAESADPSPATQIEAPTFVAQPPVTTTPDAAAVVPAFDAPAAEAPAIPAAIVRPAAAPPAAHSQAAANAVPTGATPSNAPSTTLASSRFPLPDLGSLLSRGEAMLALGDISAARLLYERAASIGSARAATALGKTYDPAFLTSIQVSGLVPSRAAAALWYRKGAEMGDAEAADRLARLTATQ